MKTRTEMLLDGLIVGCLVAMFLIRGPAGVADLLPSLMAGAVAGGVVVSTPVAVGYLLVRRGHIGPVMGRLLRVPFVGRLMIAGADLWEARHHR